MKFRATIDAGPAGLDLPREFERLATFPHYADSAAMWPGEDEPVPGQRYVVVVDANDERHAETKVREVVGPDMRIRLTPHGRRVTGPDAR